MPDRAVVSLDVGVLLGLARLDVLDCNPLFLGPYQQLATDVFRAVVHPNGAGLAAPFDDPVQAANDTFGGPRDVDLNAQACTGEVVQHVQQPKRAAISEAICHEVHRPGDVRGLRHRQRVGFVPFQPLARLDPQVQLKLAVDPVAFNKTIIDLGPCRTAAGPRSTKSRSLH